MRPLLISLIVALLLPQLVFGAKEPLITAIQTEGTETLVIQQEFDLWVVSQSNWLLTLQGQEGLQFKNPATAVLAQNYFLPGSGSGSTRLDLLLEITTGELPVGKHRFEVKTNLEGAQGYLGLLLASEYWLLPLNTGQLKVKRGLTEIPLEEGSWFFLQGEDQLFYAGEKVVNPLKARLQPRFKVQQEVGELQWETQTLIAQAGEKIPIVLNFLGNPGKIIFTGHGKLALTGPWSLEPIGHPLTTSSLGEQIIVHLPRLEEGHYQIRGYVRPHLQLSKKLAFVEAQMGSLTATLELEVKQPWFEENFVSLEVQGENQPILLPDGKISLAGRGSKLTIAKPEKLATVIPLTKPWQPLWLSDSIQTKHPWLLGPKGDGQLEFIIPIFIWDKNFDWRIVAGEKNWLLDVSAKEWSMRGKSAYLDFSGTQASFQISSRQSFPAEAGGISVFQNQTGTTISLGQGKWSSRLEIPRKQHTPSSWDLRYHGTTWRWLIGSRSKTLSFYSPSLAWGIGVQPEKAWLELQDGKIRLAANSHLLETSLRTDVGKWYLKNSWGQDLVIGFKGEKLELYWQKQPEPELAFRLQTKREGGKWDFTSSFAAQFRSPLVMVGCKQRLASHIKPNFTFYCQNIVGINIVSGGPVDLELDYGGGFVYQPIPYVYSELAWSNRKGLQFKGGLMLPFISRSGQTNCE